jgi:hypothetical protein
MLPTSRPNIFFELLQPEYEGATISRNVVGMVSQKVKVKGTLEQAMKAQRGVKEV